MARLFRSQPRIPIVAVPSAKCAAGDGRQLDPASRQDPEQVAMGEQQGVAVDPRIETPLDDPVRAGADLLDRLAAAPRPGPDAPSGISVRISAVVRPSNSP